MTNARMKVESPRCPSTQSACLPAGATAQVMRGRDEVSPGRCGSGGNLCEPVNQPACDGGLHSRALGDWGTFWIGVNLVKSDGLPQGFGISNQELCRVGRDRLASLVERNIALAALDGRSHGGLCHAEALTNCFEFAHGQILV